MDNPVTCSLQVAPRFCLCPKGFVTTARWLLCTEALLVSEIWWATLQHEEDCYTHFNVLVYNHSKEKKKKSKFQNVAELLSTLSPQKWYQFRNHEIPSQDSSVERGAVKEFQKDGDCFTDSFKRDLVGAGTLPGQGCLPFACVLLMTFCPHPYSLSRAESLALKLSPRAGGGCSLWQVESGCSAQCNERVAVGCHWAAAEREGKRKFLSGLSTQSSVWQFISYRKSCFNTKGLRGWEQWCNAQRCVLKFKWTTSKAPALLSLYSLWERMTTQKSEDESTRNRGSMREDKRNQVAQLA